VLSLGVDPGTGKPNPQILVSTNVRDTVGFPANAWFFIPYTFNDANNDGIIGPNEVTVGSNYVYAGYSQPRDIFSLQNGFDVFQRKLRVTFLLDYKGGYGLLNQTTQFYCSNFNTCFEETNKSAPLWQQARVIAQRYEPVTTQAGYLENGQFWRLREVSAVLNLPEQVASRIRAR